MRSNRRGPLAIKASVLVVVLLAGLAWFVVTREVVLRIDGVAKVVHTHAPDVRTLLAATGHELRRHDDINPRPSSSLRNGLTVDWNRARPIELTLDGKTKKAWVTSRTVAGVLREVGAPLKDVRLSEERDADIPLEGMKIIVGTKKTISLVVAKQPKEVTTYAGTVEDLLREEKITLDRDDRTVPKQSAALKQGIEVKVQRVTIRKATEEVAAPAPEQKTEDGSLMEDQLKVVDAGSEGKAREEVEYIVADGDVIERRVIHREVLAEPKPRIVVKGTKPYPKEMSQLNWTALAKCESGGNPSSVSSNGLYHGLYQFNQGTWEGVGGVGAPSEATAEEQTYRAWMLYQKRGVAPWPHCGPLLLS